MFFRKRNIVIGLLFTAVVISACKKAFNDANSTNDSNLTVNLYRAIQQNNGTAIFASLLIKSGYATLLASGTKSYTVWVPTDAALASLPSTILNDTALLRKFVGNHIANGTYNAGSVTLQRIPMLNGKYNNMIAGGIDSANFTASNKYASNGVWHIIDKYIPARDNCWEWINNSTNTANSKALLQFLNYNFFDSTLATQTGVDPNTGAPIYKAGTGIVVKNKFLVDGVNINDESTEYTFLVLDDGSFTTEYNKLSPWFKTGSTDSTKTLTGFWLYKDLAVKGSYAASALPDTLLSQFGVKVPVDKSKITASYKTSNGWVHVMSQVNFNLNYKFPPIILEGENPSGFAADRTANALYRIRINPNTGATFKDLLMQNYGYAGYWIRYLAKGLNSMRYNAYWVSVNDVQTTPLWTQKLCIDSANNPTTFTYVTVPYQNYNEVSLGQFTIANYRNVNLFVVGANTSSTSGGSVSIDVDYIKLVPAF